MVIQLPEVAQALLNPKIYPDQPDRVELIQTQMSMVFLAGQFVYKVKKPVNLGYLDYTTLEKRLYFCRKEVELNSRLCPEVYLGVVPIKRTGSGVGLGGRGKILDYAVKMKYLPQDRMLNILLENDQVESDMMLELAVKLAKFHAQAATGPTISFFGTIEAIRINTDENFAQTEKYSGHTITQNQYRRIEKYTIDFLQTKAEVFHSRVTGGRIRDGHGDLHSQHICFINSICIFDCIEFIDRFRYSDVAADIAFLAMDLDHYGRADLSRALVGSYIEHSRDPQLIELLKFYKCYRAYVRGKVDSFKSDDPYISEPEKEQSIKDARSYFELADSYCRSQPTLFITAGLTGSGKSTLAGALAGRLGLTVVSSDEVRKRLAGVPPGEHRFETMGEGIYSPALTQLTYANLLAEGKRILVQGDPVILDATFLRKEDRLKARKLAEETNSRFWILECQLDETRARQRLEKRRSERSISDGRWEIYEAQKKNFEPVTEAAPDQYTVIKSAHPVDQQISQIIERY